MASAAVERVARLEEMIMGRFTPAIHSCSLILLRRPHHLQNLRRKIGLNALLPEEREARQRQRITQLLRRS